MFCTWAIGKILYIFTLSIHPIQLPLSPFHDPSLPPITSSTFFDTIYNQLNPSPAPPITDFTWFFFFFFFFLFLIVIFISTNSWPPPPSSTHPKVLSIGFFFFSSFPTMYFTNLSFWMVYRSWVVGFVGGSGWLGWFCWKIWFCISYKTHSGSNRRRSTSFMRDNM